MFTTKLTASLFLISFAAFAADTNRWSNLQSLHPGDRIGIVQTNQKRVEGHFVRANDSEVTVAAGQEITLSENQVVRVYKRPRLRRSTRILVGTCAGLAAGIIINATIGERFRNEGSGIAAGAILGGAAAGAGAGFLSGGDYKTIYQR